MGIYRGTGGTGDSTTDTTVTTVTEKAAEAASSATSAANSATSAANSASSASTSATNAATSETNAANSATASATSATNSASNANSASTSATNAANSAYNASVYRNETQTLKTQTESLKDTTILAATAASGHADDAETAYANTLAIYGSTTDVQNAVNSASTSATNAATSATQAATSATNAANSATSAGTSETNAASSASQAATSAASANSYATDAQTAQTAAETAQAAAEAAEYNINGLYLGSLANDPTLDGNGVAVTTGDLYFNTTAQEVRVYTDGDVWEPVVDLAGDITVNSLTSNNNVVVKGNLEVQGTTITVDSATAQTIDLGDNDKIRLGDSDDLQIYHSGTHSYISDQGTGNLIIEGAHFLIQTPNAEKILQGLNNGAVSLYYDGATKLATTSSGVDITGDLVADGLTVDGDGTFDGDTSKVTIKAFQPKLIFDDDSAVGGGSDKLILQSVVSQANGDYEFVINNDQTLATDQTILKFYGNGDISFYEDTGTTAKLTWDASSETLDFQDNATARFGTGYDLQIYHDSSNSWMYNFTGSLNIVNTSNDNDINILSDDGSGSVVNYFKADGSTGESILYHYGSQKLATKSTGIAVTDLVSIYPVDSSSDGLIFENTGGAQVKQYFTGSAATDNFVITRVGTGGSEISLTNAGAVILAHGSTNRFATTSTGIDVTGTVTADGLTVDQSGIGTIGNVELKTISSFDTSNALPSIGRSTTSIGGSGTGTLVIQGRSDLPRSVIIATGDTSTSRFHETGDISFYNDAGTSQDFYWDASTSRLGLGVTSPSYQLQLGGSSDSTLAFFRSTTDTAQIVIRDDDTIGYFGARNNFIYISPTSGTGADGLVVRTDTGNVGIGTTSPSSKLQIQAGDLNVGGNDSSNPFSKIRLGASQYGACDIVPTDESNHKIGMAFYVDGTQDTTINPTEAMRITSSGSVGIGTTSPLAKLHVYGSSLFRGSTSSASTEYTSLGVINGWSSNGVTAAKIGFETGSDIHKSEITFNTADSYNALTERMRLDSSGRLGLGTTSPSSYNANADNLVISTSANSGLTINSGTASTGNIFFSDGTSGSEPFRGYIQYDHSSDSLRLGASGSEKARIDSSGNLLVGTTDSTLYNNTSGEGVGLIGGDHIEVARSGGPPIFLNRMTSDGNIAVFNKDGTTVGSIGTFSNDAYIATNDTGLRFIDSVEAITPFNGTTVTNRDAAISLGLSSYRFTDLYLSGGVYLGGTGSANLLDDYEEGTFTPSFLGTTTSDFTYNNQEGYYVKIGNLVYVSGYLRLSSKGTSSGQIKIASLPFTSGAFMPGTSFEFGGNITYFDALAQDISSATVVGDDNATSAYMYFVPAAGDNIPTVMQATHITNTFQIRFSFHYVAA